MSTGGNNQNSGGRQEAEPVRKASGAAVPAQRASEISGLVDLKALAARAIHSQQERVWRSTGSRQAIEPLMVASATTTGRVLLVAPSVAVVRSANVAATSSLDEPHAAVAATLPEPAPRSMTPARLYFAGTVVVAGALVFFALELARSRVTAAQAGGATGAAGAPRGVGGAGDGETTPTVAPLGDAVGGGGGGGTAAGAAGRATEPIVIAAAGSSSAARSSKDGAGGSPGSKSLGGAENPSAVIAPVTEFAKEAAQVPAKEAAKEAAKELTQSPSRAQPSKTEDQQLAAIFDATGTGSSNKSKAVAAVVEEKPTLGRDDIKKGMSLARARVEDCYRRYKVPGTVMVKTKIEQNGMVSSSEPQGIFSGTETGFCVAQAVETARFPAFTGPPVNVNYPFKLD